MIVLFALTLGTAYLLGSIPSALWICRIFFHVDITKVGSGNPGMTNVWRALGWKPALPVVVADAAKGFLSAYLGLLWTHSILWALLAGIAAVVGHLFPLFARFKGGKGVLTAFGAFLFLSPIASLSSLTVWILMLLLFRIVSVSSMSAAITLPLFVFFESLWHGNPGINPVFWAALVVAVFVLIRHRANFSRLLNGTEPRFQGKAL